MTILLDYFSDYLDGIEVDQRELEPFKSAIADTNSPRIKLALKREMDKYIAEAKQNDANDAWCEASNYLRDMTYHISAPITKRTRQMWNGTQTVEEDTKEERTLSEWIDQILSAGSFDDYRVYTEDGEVLMDFVHHDGTNHYRFGHHLAGEIEKALDY